jgi:hypothetical protein
MAKNERSHWADKLPVRTAQWAAGSYASKSTVAGPGKVVSIDPQ